MGGGQQAKVRSAIVVVVVKKDQIDTTLVQVPRYVSSEEDLLTEVGARSWEKSGDGMSMFAKCAACPASCIRVVKEVRPEPMAEGSARLVKCAVEGCQVPSLRRQAGWGLETSWQLDGWVAARSTTPL